MGENLTTKNEFSESVDLSMQSSLHDKSTKGNFEVQKAT